MLRLMYLRESGGLRLRAGRGRPGPGGNCALLPATPASSSTHAAVSVPLEIAPDPAAANTSAMRKLCACSPSTTIPSRNPTSPTRVTMKRLHRGPRRLGQSPVVPDEQV
ncbi:hypothetical protein GCM10020218_057350 [Dactylosporangium vinaceum]